jgi:hypothetical protein
VTNNTRLFTIIATKSELSPVVLQEDADCVATATKNAIARLPAYFVDAHDLPLIDQLLSGAAITELRKDDRQQSVWWWPNSTQVTSPFNLCIVETKLEGSA